MGANVPKTLVALTSPHVLAVCQWRHGLGLAILAQRNGGRRTLAARDCGADPRPCSTVLSARNEIKSDRPSGSSFSGLPRFERRNPLFDLHRLDRPPLRLQEVCDRGGLI